MNAIAGVFLLHHFPTIKESSLTLITHFISPSSVANAMHETLNMWY